MKAEPIRLRLVGTKRLIMHCGRLADPLDPISKDLARLTGKRAKTEADHEEIGRVEWNGGLWLDGGKPAVPAEALMATFVAAARLRRRTMQAEAGLVVYHNAALVYDGPDDMDQLWEDERFRFRAGVVVNGNRTMRTRPVFNGNSPHTICPHCWIATRSMRSTRTPASRAASATGGRRTVPSRWR
jgi:hypothetical protein